MGQVLHLDSYRKRPAPDPAETMAALWAAWFDLMFWWVPKQTGP